MTRHLIAAAVVLGCAAAVGLGSRTFAKAPTERAEDFRMRGPADAPIRIVEFSDFQCPACRAAEPAVKQVLSVYGAQTRFIFKNFPLERMHEHARAGATAAECAGRQGKFWEYHDALYDKQPDWTADGMSAEQTGKLLRAYAKDLKLDAAAFEACLADPSVQTQIDADIAESRDRWVNSTPTFFVNGKRFVGGRQLQERGSRWIEKALKPK